jgi:DHA1 family tetracycline resistance protein-like MFS transporter
MSRQPLPPAIRFVLATMLINSIGFGIVIPSFPQLIMSLGDATLSEATGIGGLLAVVYALFQFVFGPVMGNLSDRFGRRPILLGSLLGFAVDFVVMAFAQTLAWLFAARIMTGVFGASNAPSQSVVADLVKADDRSRLFGYMSAAFGIGFVAGPALGGLLAEISFRMPFYAAGALAVANFIYGLVALPETLDREHRRPFDWRRANPVGALFYVRKLPGILPISIVYFLWQLASLVYPLTWAYFTIGRYGWSNGLVGLSLALLGATMAITQIFLLSRIVARFGERMTATIGLIGGALCLLAFAFISSGWLAFAAMPLIAIQSLVHPCLTAMMSRRADVTNQGEVQGFASSVMAVGSIFAPLLFNPALAWFTGPGAPVHFFGIAFAIAAAIAALALIVLLSLARAPVPDPAVGAAR